MVTAFFVCKNAQKNNIKIIQAVQLSQRKAIFAIFKTRYAIHLMFKI